MAQRFFSDNKGNISIIMGLALVPLLTCMGAAIDLARIVNVRSGMQMALDSTALAAGSSYNLNGTASTTMAEAADFYAAENGVGTLTEWSPLVVADIGTIDAAASYSAPTSILAMFGIDTVDITVTTKVSADLRQTISSFRMRPITAKGWFDKEVTLHVEYPDDTSATPWSMTYLYDRPSDSGSITSTSEGWVDVVGADHAYLEMQIDPDSFGFEDYGDWTENRTDEPDLIDFIAFDSTPLTEPINMMDLDECGEVKQFGWEDGGDGDYIDFVFEIEFACDQVLEAEDYIRIVG